MSRRAGASAARSELAKFEREIPKIIEAIKNGIPPLSIKDEMIRLESLKAD